MTWQKLAAPTVPSVLKWDAVSSVHWGETDGARYVDTLANIGSGGTGLTYCAGYLTEHDIGGGYFVWDATQDKQNHNGGLVIDPDHSLPPGDVGYLEPDNTGTGCWLRLEYFDQSTILAAHFGAVTPDQDAHHILNKIFEVMPKAEVIDNGSTSLDGEAVTIKLPAFRMYIRETVFFDNTFYLVGAGSQTTVLYWAPNAGFEDKWAMRLNPSQENWTRPKYSWKYPTLLGGNRGTNFKGFTLITGRHQAGTHGKLGINICPSYWCDFQDVDIKFFYIGYQDFPGETVDPSFIDDDGDPFVQSVYVTLDNCTLNNNGISINSKSSALYMSNCSLTKSWSTDFTSTHPDYPVPPGQIIVRADLYITNTNVETMPGGYDQDSKTDDYAEIYLKDGGRVVGTIGTEQSVPLFSVGPYNVVSAHLGRRFGFPHIYIRSKERANVDNLNSPLPRNPGGANVTTSFTWDAKPLLNIGNPFCWLGVWNQASNRRDLNETTWSPFGSYYYLGTGPTPSFLYSYIDSYTLQALRGQTVHVMSAIKWTDPLVVDSMNYRMYLSSATGGWIDYTLFSRDWHVVEFENGWRLYTNNMIVPEDIEPDTELRSNISLSLNAEVEFWHTSTMWFVGGIDYYPRHGKYQHLLRDRWVNMYDQSGAVNIDWQKHPKYRMNLTGATTLTFDPPADFQYEDNTSEYQLFLTGSGAITWPANVINPPASVPPSTVVRMLWDGTDYLVI